MTIASATNKSGPYFYNGSATSFAYQFKISNAAHIRVVETVISTGLETDLALNTDYTVTGVGADAGGNVVITPARASGKTATLVRKNPFTQEVVLENQGAYLAKVVEGALDDAVARDQQLQEQISRAVVVPLASDVSPSDLISDLTEKSAAAVAAAAAALVSANNANSLVAPFNGGAAGQFLAKASSTPFDVKWANSPGGRLLSSFASGAGQGNATADTAAFVAALASGEKSLVIDAAEFTLLPATYAVPVGMHIRGVSRKYSILRCADPLFAAALLKLGNDTSLSSFSMRGPQDTVSTYVSGQKAIGGYSESDFPSNLRINDLEIWGWADCGIHIVGDRSGVIERNYIHDCGRMGARFTGGIFTKFNFNRVENIAPGSGGNAPAINAYGVSFSHDGATTGYEKPTDIQCIGNYIKGVPSWEGIDCHSVDGFDVSHNTVLDTMIGIYLGPSSGSNNTNGRRFRCVGNHIETTSPYRRQGIIVIPSANGWTEGNGLGMIVSKNIIIGHGLNQALFNLAIGITTGAAITIAYADHALIEGNQIHGWNYAAIELQSNMNGGEVTGNSIGDGVATNSVIDAIRITDPTTISATVGRNTIRRTTGAMIGVDIVGTAGASVFGPRVHRQNMIGVATPLSTGSWAKMHEESEYELYGNVNTNLSSIAALGNLQFVITVTDAAIGDEVKISPNTNTAGVVFDGVVSAADTVTVTAFNATGAAIDPASTIYYARVKKRGKR